MKTALTFGLLFGASTSLSTLAATVLYDFETDAEQKAVPRLDGKDFQVGVTNAYATSGEHAIGFVCRPWSEGMNEWPSFTIASPVADWRGYDRLVVDVVNAGEAGDSLSTFIAEPKGRIQNGLHATMRLPGKGHAQWTIPLKDWPQTAAPTNVARIHFFATRPMSFAVALDRLTLLKAGETPPLPDSPCVARNLLPLAAEGREQMKRQVAEMEEWKSHARDYMRFRTACQTSGLSSPALLLGKASSMEKIMPRGRFSALPVTKDGLAVRLAGNEYESVQLLVAPTDSDLADVKVRVEGDLKGPNATFAATNVACDVTGYVKTTSRPPYKVGRAVPANDAPG